MTGKWEPLHSFEVDDAAPTGIKGRASKLRKRVEAMNADRATLDADIAAFRAEPDVKALAEGGFEKSRELKLRRVQLLQAELQLRGELGTLRDEYRQSLAEPQESAFEAEKKVRADVLAGLVDLGFPCGPASDPNERRRFEAYCHSNLRVREAVARKEDITTCRRDIAYNQANVSATNAVQAELQRIRDTLTTI